MEVLVIMNIQSKKPTKMPDDKRDELEEHQEKHHKEDQDNDGEKQQLEMRKKEKKRSQVVLLGLKTQRRLDRTYEIRSSCDL